MKNSKPNIFHESKNTIYYFHSLNTNSQKKKSSLLIRFALYFVSSLQQSINLPTQIFATQTVRVTRERALKGQGSGVLRERQRGRTTYELGFGMQSWNSLMIRSRALRFLSLSFSTYNCGCFSSQWHGIQRVKLEIDGR